MDRSRYFFQLEQYLESFPESSILIITSEALSQFPQQTMAKVFQFLEVDPTFQFKLNTQNLSEIVKFGPAIANFNFKFDTKLHNSALKRRMKVPKDSKVMKVLSDMMKPIPAEIRVHVEKLVYWPLSEKIERPELSESLQNRLLDAFSEDIQRLKAYTGYNFDEWNIR